MKPKYEGGGGLQPPKPPPPPWIRPCCKWHYYFIYLFIWLYSVKKKHQKFVGCNQQPLTNYGGIILGIMGNSQKHNTVGGFLSTAQKHNAQFLEHNSLMPSPHWVSMILHKM